MDLKGITWVGNIYQKFETMCLEVEEIMYQDTVDLIENHVQTVGASVKKFYSDVVQDLLPPSSLDDSGKKDISGIDLQEYKDVEIVKKPKVGRKFAERKNVGITPRNVENALPMATRMTSEIRTSTNDGNLVKENQTSEICEVSLREIRMENQVEEATEDDDDASRSAAENAKRCEEVIADHSSWDLAASSSQEAHMGNNAFCSVERPIDIEDIQYNNVSEEEIDLFNPGEVEDSYMICTDSSCLLEQKEATFTRTCNLEESCIFVDEDEVELLALNKGKHRHNKKTTLREAFSPRKRSSRAQEYKQLAAKYSDEARTSEEQRGQSSVTALGLEEGGESEWEIL